MERTERQKQSVEKWRLAKGIGTVEACTGYGKTRCATDILLQLQNVGKSGAIVVVPTDALKRQWTKILSELGIYNVKVYIINSLVIEKVELRTTILVLDEIHMYAADTFYKVFDKVTYTYILGLTATLERLDEKHILLEQHSPVVDTITLREAKSNGWVSDFIEYNLYITMEEEEKAKYDSINNIISSLFATFRHDYNAMRSCTIKYGFQKDGKYIRGASDFVRDNSNLVLYDGFNNRLLGDALITEVSKHANICLRKIRERQDFLDKFPRKVNLTAEIIAKFKKKTVTFGNNTDMADDVNAQLMALGIDTAAYHSNLQSEERIENEVKSYKTQKAAERFRDKTEGASIEYDDEADVFYVIYPKTFKYGAKRLKEDTLTKLENDSISVINTAKALDLGLDVSGMEMAIIYAGKGNPTTQQQRIGRVVRKEGDKTSIIINLIIKHTQDEKWARRRQIKNERYIRHVESINEIIV